MKVPDLEVGKRLFVGCGNPTALGVGEEEIRGAVYLEGPVQIGNPAEYSEVEAEVMIATDINEDSPNNGGPTALWVKGNQFHVGTWTETGLRLHTGDSVQTGNKTHNGNLITSNLVSCTGTGCAWSGSTINVQGWKGFDIEHPSKKGHRLRHICLEGPEGAIFTRGTVKNQTEINLPDYWKDFVDISSISVQLQPIGSHQDVIVKRIDEEKVYLQSKAGFPINCYYHIFAERTDGEKLIVEYKGDSAGDYPGDNTQYSIAGYHYDTRGGKD